MSTRAPAPTTSPLTSTAFLDRLLHRRDPAAAERPALAVRRAGRWTERTYADLEVASRRVAGWLAARGVSAGDRVVVLGQPGPEWVAALLGAWRTGAVVVPLDARAGATELRPLVARTAAVAAVVSLAGRVDLGPAAPAAVLGFESIDALDDVGPDTGAAAGRGGDDAALVVWTSGTSGRAKGVVLSFANLAYVVDAGCAAHRLDPDDRWLSVLPLDHMLELSCGLLPALASGASFGFTGTVAAADVAAAMAERRFSRMTVVPLLLASVLRAVEADARRSRRTTAALRAASAVSRLVPCMAVRRRLFGTVHRRLGGGRPTFHCGGARLDADVARRFELLGMPVYCGYGLTEVSPTVAMNTPAHHRAGSVGRPLPGTEVRIEAAAGEAAAGGGDGEILVRSPGVMLGYWDDPELTATVVDADGWLHTGDLGHLDARGYLHVTGRAKSLIVLASGRKVQPEEVEAALEGGDAWLEACVVGWTPPAGDRAGAEQVCVVIVPSPALLGRCPTRRSVQTALEAEVGRRCAGLAAFRRPTVVREWAGSLPRTPKRSVRRDEVVRQLDAAAGRSADAGPGRRR